MAKMTKKDKEEQQRQIENLRRLVKPGDKVYASIVHVSRSGMSRAVRLYIVHEGDIMEITGMARIALNDNVSRHDQFSINVGGCGFDAGHDCVYRLGHALFPDGGALENSVREAQERRSGAVRETDPGYLLRHVRM